MRVVLHSRFPADPQRPRGGVEAVTVVLVRALARLPDLDVHVVTLERKRSARAVERCGEATIHRLPTSRWPQMMDILVGPGRRSLVRYVLSLEPDIVHSHETHGLALYDLPVPHVFTVHGFDHANLLADEARAARLRSALWRRIERHGFGRHRHIISISPYVRQMLTPLTRATIYDIDNPIDEAFFAVDRRAEPGRVLCVGWVIPRKNTLGALRAFSRVVAAGADARLVIAGTPKEQDYYQQVLDFIAANRLNERVELLGHIGHEELREQLSRAAVFLLASRQENSPMAIAEAMAVGVPVVASNRCGMPYMIEEGRSGFLVEPEDDGQIADRLRRLLNDASAAEQMGKRGREIALARFHPDAVARRTREVYQRVIAGSARPVPA